MTSTDDFIEVKVVADAGAHCEHYAYLASSDSTVKFW